jgi:hypothetical protein
MPRSGIKRFIFAAANILRINRSATAAIAIFNARPFGPASVRSMRLGFTRRLLVIVGLGVLVAGCGTAFDRRPGPACPPILVLKDAGTLTRYKPGPGQDVTDVIFRSQVVNFQGACDFDKDRNEVKISLKLFFELTRGPANKDRKAKFQYFAAIPHFYPAVQGRNVFSMEAKFADRDTRVGVEDEIEMVIPLNPKEPIDKYAVYLGFQLTRDELKNNRRAIKF